ncbi:IRK-interacting protein [Linum grandiflorum]
MAPPPPLPSSSSSSSSSPSSPNPPPPPLLSSYHFSHFTPIQECEREEQDDDYSEPRSTPKLHPTPAAAATGGSGRRRKKSGDDGSVSCNKCRPHSREKISVVPLDNSSNNNNNNKHSFIPSSIPSPNGIFKSIFSSLTRKSPKSAAAAADGGGEKWKIAAAEISQKLIQTTRKKDEAVLEASRLKYSMAELEKKLKRLESNCHDLKYGIEECSSSNNLLNNSPQSILDGGDGSGGNKLIVDQFLVAVSESRSSVRILTRSLTVQLKQLNACKVFDKMSALLQPYDVKVSLSKNPKGVLHYLEALLNRAFFEDFETIGFSKSSAVRVLNPIDRCESNYACFEVLKALTWEEVLSKGTRHFSEEFSRFCDRKMNDVVSMLGWNRAWPEPLLQAFFLASKAVWLVHLLANSVHPGLPVFRVERGMGFESVYMEDMGGDRARKLVPGSVRIMVAPGFYVYGNVVKCKVLCRYLNNSSSSINGSVDDL